MSDPIQTILFILKISGENNRYCRKMGLAADVPQYEYRY